jgi:hypothetical protein
MQKNLSLGNGIQHIVAEFLIFGVTIRNCLRLRKEITLAEGRNYFTAKKYVGKQRDERNNVYQKATAVTPASQSVYAKPAK